MPEQADQQCHHDEARKDDHDTDADHVSDHFRLAFSVGLNCFLGSRASYPEAREGAPLGRVEIQLELGCKALL